MPFIEFKWLKNEKERLEYLRELNEESSTGFTALAFVYVLAGLFLLVVMPLLLGKFTRQYTGFGPVDYMVWFFRAAGLWLIIWTIISWIKTKSTASNKDE